MDVQIDKRDGVLSITLARPAKKNALTGAMYQAMADALAAAREDKAVSYTHLTLPTNGW